MAKSAAEPRGIVLLTIAFLTIAILLILSLTPTETILLPVLCLAYQMFHRFNLFNDLSFYFRHDQDFSAHSELIYKSKLSGRKIRLLRLLPGLPNSTIRCRLVEASLEDVPSYDAISYVWGPPQKRERISCDGQVAYITVSLAQALRRLRHRTTPRTLWADGICINQNDVSEKGHQVERMGEIFKKAKTVVVWLGPDEDGNVARAMAVIQYVHSKIPNPGHGAEAVQSPGVPTIRDLEKLVESEKGVRNAWTVLGTLFERQWWQRIWCVQEAILAKGTVIMCGSEQIDGKLIGVFTRWHHGQRWAGQRKPLGFNEDGIKSAYRRLNKWAWTGTFLEILDIFRGLQATDPRDKVYALLGLLQLNRKENIWKLNMSVDYHKSVPEVLFDSVMCSIRSEGNLHFLSYVDHRPDLEDRRDCPSWMPRWHETREPWQDHLWCDRSSLSAGKLELSMSSDNWTYSEKLTLKGADLFGISTTTDVCWPTDDVIGEPLYWWIKLRLLEIKAETSNGDMPAYRRSITRLATTLSGGFLKTGGWVENRVYFERLGGNIGKQYLADFFVFIDTNFPELNMPKLPGLDGFEGLLQSYHPLVKTYCGGRRLFETVNGHIGLGPRSMRPNDIVAVLNGGKVPYVLRCCEGGREFSFLGECFVFDITDTQGSHAGGVHRYEERDIVLR